MATPQMPRDDLMKYLRELEARIAQVEKRDAFINTAFSVPSPGVTQVDGTLIVNGTIESSNYDGATQGWASNNQTMTTFTAIEGFVGGQSLGGVGQNFALSTTKSTVASVSITVPAGFTRCNAFVGGQIFMNNPNTTGGSNGAGGDYIYPQVFMDSYYGASLPKGISGANGAETATTMYSFGETGLTTGQTINFTLQGYTAYQTLPANSSNTAILSVAVSWLP